MSDSHSAKNDFDVETQLDDDVDESVVAERQPRAPSMQRLGRYRLVREIASGGMATVNLAVTEGLDKLVALKIIHPHLAQEESFVRMFLDEARLASAISHRNVCSVFDFGEMDGRFYIAMDYLSGQSLRDVLRRLRKTPLEIEPRKLAVYVAYMIAEACEGLHAAHELHGSEGQPLNVVHRDVSPHNLFVTYDGNVSVVDFGIARASDRIQSTATGVLKGKFSYMAPEQMRQLEIDRRADVWALGVVLWESLTLQRLFVRSSQADTVMSVMMDRVRPPSEVNPDIPKELDAVVQRSICRAPNQRYTTAREMGRELMKFCRESGVSVGPIEIEHLLARLFEKEIVESKQLLRRAKASGNESGVWMDMTPSGFARVSRTSGSLEASKWNTAAPSVSVVTDGSQSASMRVPGGSLSAPAIEARTTAHTDLNEIEPKSKKKPMGALIGIGAVALVAATWLVVKRTEEPAAIANQAAVPEQTAQPPMRPDNVPQTGAVGASPAPTQQAAQAPNAPEPVAAPQVVITTQVPAVAMHGAARLPPRRAPQRAAGRGVSAREEHDAEAPLRGAIVEEAPTHVAEPAPVARVVEEEPAPLPQPVAQPAIQQAPAPVAVKSVPPPAPPGPQRFDAKPAIADLDVEGSLGSGIVSRMLSRANAGLKSCYADAAKHAGRNDFSSLHVSLVIDEGGAVRQVNASRHSLPELSSCASSALKRMRSERVPDVGTVQVQFNVTFTP